MQGWFGGQEMAGALVDVLFGDTDPSGRLPTTVPVRMEHNPSFGNFPGENAEVRYGESIFVGYRWYDARKLPVRFPFGHGLSYSTFEIGAPAITHGPSMRVDVPVTNTGTRRGAEVVQCYVAPSESMLVRPPKELKAYAKVWLAPGETKTVTLELDNRAFSYWDPGAADWPELADRRARRERDGAARERPAHRRRVGDRARRLRHRHRPIGDRPRPSGHGEHRGMTPLGARSVSLRLYPHLDLGATAVVEELRAQAALAAATGFDGVMTSEHHGGFAGYLPNPLQAAGWCLEAMSSGWAAACPLLLPLRPAALVAEEVAWLAARFPGRVGVGVAAGALPADFEIMETNLDDLTARFASGLSEMTRLLTDGDPGGPLAGDPAIAACAQKPVPVVSAASSVTAARRAAQVGAGLLFDSLSTVDRCRTLSDAYRAAGGTAPCILIRRAWIGEAPRADMDAQVGVYRSYAPGGAQQHWGGDEQIAGTPAEVAAGLVAVLERAGADALNVRVHFPGVPPDVIREQIERLGRDVVGLVKEAL